MPPLGKFECETNGVNFVVGEVGALYQSVTLDPDKKGQSVCRRDVPVLTTICGSSCFCGEQFLPVFVDKLLENRTFLRCLYRIRSGLSPSDLRTKTATAIKPLECCPRRRVDKVDWLVFLQTRPGFFNWSMLWSRSRPLQWLRPERAVRVFPSTAA